MKLRLRSAILVTSALALFGVSSASAQTAAPPAAAEQDPASSRTGPISGYMDFHFNKLEGTRTACSTSTGSCCCSTTASRRAFASSASWSSSTRSSRGSRKRGSSSSSRRTWTSCCRGAFNVRAGMLLVPLGIINERHEPPVFNGVERPFVDTVIIPTTWFEVGAGVHGEFGRGFRYRAYAMAPLDALEFSADEGIREGRQKGAEANVRNFAFTGRVEYVGIPDLTVGGGLLDGRVQLSRRRASIRPSASARSTRATSAAASSCADSSRRSASATPGELNDAIERHDRRVSPNIAKTLRGFYGEAAYRVWDAGSPRDLVAFVRYENFDTQYRMPDGFLPLKEFDRDAWVVGAHVLPRPRRRRESRLRLPVATRAASSARRARSTSAWGGGSDMSSVMTGTLDGRRGDCAAAGARRRPRQQPQDRARHSRSTPSDSPSRRRGSRSTPARKSSSASRATTPRTASGSSAPRHDRRSCPKRGKGEVVVSSAGRASRGATCSSATGCAAPATTSCEASWSCASALRRERPVTRTRTRAAAALSVIGWRRAPAQLSADSVRRCSPAIRCRASRRRSSRSSASGSTTSPEVETAEEGLGPAFNGTSCAVCHNVPAIGGGGVCSRRAPATRTPTDRSAGSTTRATR